MFTDKDWQQWWLCFRWIAGCMMQNSCTKQWSRFNF